MAGSDSGALSRGGTRPCAACPLVVLLALSLAVFRVDPALGSEAGDWVRRAKDQRLAQDPYWGALVHYQPHLGGKRSLIDDPRFFLSARGKSDPEAELEATLLGFASEDVDGVAHPLCRFPLRASWLFEKLGVASAELPPATCAERDDALRRLEARSAALVFPTAFLNGPASMFGHTLLRIDSSRDSPLLSYAVTYAARTDPSDNGVSYALKGLFGQYRGYFSILPYYEKVREYGNIEQRDIWEYRLNLTQEEIQRLVLHTLELRDIHADYFFFDENCSYALLFLLDAARPGLSLSSGYGLWVTPVDTVNDILGAGLVESVVYRPSPVTQMRFRASPLGRENLQLALDLAGGRADPRGAEAAAVDQGEAARVLDVASQYTQILYSREELSKEEYLKRFLGILTARSRLREAPAAEPPPAPARPEEGHRSSRVSVAGGTHGGDSFAEVAARPAYHDLLDSDLGYAEGAQIVFASVAARWYPEERRVTLQAFDLIDIVSLAPRDQFFQPVSWKVRTGLESEDFGDDEQGLVGLLEGGGGLAWKTAWLGVSHLFADAAARVSGRYRDGFAGGLGASAGTVRAIGEAWKVGVEARHLAFALGDRGRESALRVRQSLRVARDHSLCLDVGRLWTQRVATTEASLSWRAYY